MFQWFQTWLLFRKIKLCDDAVPSLTTSAEYSSTTLPSAFTLWPVHPIAMEAKMPKVKIVVSCLFMTKRFGCPAKLMFFSRIISNLATTKDDFEYAA